MRWHADGDQASLWSATAEEAAVAAPMLAGEHDADAVVIGGGITGCSAALHLAAEGARVVLLEALRIGWGASGRNGGQVIPGLKLDPSELVARFGEARGAALAAAVGRSADLVFDLIDRHTIRCAPVRQGWIQAAHAPDALPRIMRRAEEWRALGAPVEILDRRAIADRLGTATYFGGWCDRRAGTIQPLAYVRGLARAAREAGASLHAASPVRRLERWSGGWRVVTPEGCVRARGVIVGTDGYTDGLVPGLARTLAIVQSIQVATAPLPDRAAGILAGGECVSETRRLAFYFRRAPDNRLVFGGRGPIAEAGSHRFFGHLAAALRRTFPAVSDLEITHRWSGQVALTLDGLPRIHEPANGLLLGLGYNGRGVAMATLMGQWLAARLHRGIEAPLPPSTMRPIPWYPLRRPAIAAGIALAWMRDRLGHAA